MSGTKDGGDQTGGPLDQRQRYDDYIEAHQTGLDGRQAQIHTSQPGLISSFDAGAMTVKVQPATQAMETQQDGSRKPVDPTPLHDVPVHFPGGGGYTLTFPINGQDEALLIHQHRSIDNWHTMGGTQPISDYRMHDVNDAVAMVGLRNKTRALSGVHTGNVQLRSDDGSRFLEINNSGDTIRVVAGGTTITVDNSSGKVTVVAKTIELDGATKVTVNAPLIELNGEVVMNGPRVGMTATSSLNIKAPLVTVKSPAFKSGA